jgi:hypothetical protein
VQVAAVVPIAAEKFRTLRKHVPGCALRKELLECDANLVVPLVQGYPNLEVADLRVTENCREFLRITPWGSVLAQLRVLMCITSDNQRTRLGVTA